MMTHKPEDIAEILKRNCPRMSSDAFGGMDGLLTVLANNIAAKGFVIVKADPAITLEKDDLDDALDWALYELKKSLGSRKTTHKPEEIEAMARLLCVADGHDPDEIIPPWVKGSWDAYTEQADSLLGHLQAKGWKITNRDCDEVGVWREMHDAAPIVPGGDRDE